MNGRYLDKITHADCREHLPQLEDDSVELLLSDIPYGIAMDDWDVLHSNQNSALLGESPAQQGKPAFKRRGKPINGWSARIATSARNTKTGAAPGRTWCSRS